MLAGESFSDHPRSVSRPIASFLRGYNDLFDDRRRGRPVPVRRPDGGHGRLRTRSRTPGSAACSAGATSCWRQRAVAARCSSGCGCAAPPRSARAIPSRPGTYAVHAIGKVTGMTHDAALALVDELIAMGPPAGPGVERGVRRRVARRAAPRYAARIQAAGRSASSSRLSASSASALRSSRRTVSWEIPSRRPVSMSGVGSSPPTP